MGGRYEEAKKAAQVKDNYFVLSLLFEKSSF